MVNNKKEKSYMLKSIIIATENFCIHQIREKHTLNDSIPNTKTFIAYIDIEANDSKKYRVYIAVNHGFAQRVSKLYLEEDESDEETLTDMVLELTNLIIGSAKVLAENEGKNPFNISTPNFEKIDIFDYEYEDSKVIKVDKDEIIVAIKEI
jgi:CheY-specific phosphatase CheX